MNQNSSLPVLVDWLLRHALPESYRESALGDVSEEYQRRKQANTLNALIWLANQTLRVCIQSLSGVLAARAVVVFLVLMTVFLLPTTFLMVVWLSNMEGTSPSLLEPLLVGDMHRIVIQPAFWQEAYLITDKSREAHMFINVEALLWSALSMTILLLKQSKLTSNQLAALGMSLMLVPYLWGMLVLGMFPPGLRYIGPMLAFTLFCLMYLAVPVSALVFWHKNREIKAAQCKGVTGG